MDSKYMKRAIELAFKGRGYTSPNPLVGAVIVKEGRVIGEGYHEYYGGNHAEVNAINTSSEDVAGATMYVTLEPCSHFGKTPPCAKLIIDKKIKEVIIGMMDPNPIVAGRGIKLLRDQGIKVTVGILEEEVRRLNEIFIKYITTKLPFCILKTAMTLDGKIATNIGDSKWITNEKSREYVHEIRHEVSGIMVGIGTVLADNPSLTTRLKDKEGSDPVRIIVDTECRIPLESKVLNLDSKVKTIIATTEKADKDKIKLIKEKKAEVIITPLKNNRVDLGYLIKKLGEMKIDSILIEGGSTLNYSILKEGCIDKVISFIAPKIIGGENAKTPIGGVGIDYIKDSIELKNIQSKMFDQDIMIEGYLRKEE
ncbi:MAG: bifunctional diaminohydroxyphosphoribosylaminopyrimidine deaminase/5-amino-6-(5-phosphoribosylamino)uracil reductase RibD [Tepidibacter sp.]|uniref:bifunctional diaminohydroxyphosphoribosylaminopyrimidine deaminase/5-amino-6-(5-phosphoribosylamino)uracil reductase RibD n=1 Tax=Tepidibacter sp. TaxID=2529387 RepID=UPI0025F4DC8E|nr:bifunctional diaminohydroxyphosphoribosylaminopyrimidine deaminase/5-amino-6-(5-phosphoribosylamino)uracil reductase RibD [Tepidibacter sp.]MCT4509326.1 bifunctional diaminohydroxyphosphoribosylaminopyrimidine deaminase/5-amino-6-(5-phosphoribosylamino)uracil reductase RibD [Tepidibacter sp.]